MNRTSHVMAAQIAAELMKAPVGVKQVSLSLNIAESSSHRVRKYIEAFRAVGLVYVAAWTNQRFPIYAWQPEPWKCPDVARPKKKHNIGKVSRQPLKMGPLRVVPNSVFALGAAA